MPAIVGLTGGIGCGKSAVEQHFNALGIPSVDMDVVARQVVAPGTQPLAQISQYFQSKIPNITLPDGSLNRSALREHVFSHPKDKAWLEQLLHPAIRKHTASALTELQAPYALLVSPLLFEKNSEHDLSIVVDIPEAMQLKRAAARDGASEQQIAKIMAAQWPRAKRNAQADFIIDNSSSLEDTQKQVSLIHQRLLERFQ